MEYLSFVSYFDLFHLPVVFYFRKKPHRSSSLGLSISIGIYIFLTVSFFSSQFYLKIDPISITNTFYAKAPVQIPFDNSTINKIGLYDENFQLFFDPSIFYLEMKFLTYELDDHGISHLKYQESIPINKCSQQSSLNMTLCLDEGKKFKIYGRRNDLEASFITLNLKICVNGTRDIVCKDPQTILDFFSKKKFLSFAYKESIFDLNQYVDPIQNAYQIFYQLLDFEIEKKMKLYTKKFKIITDDGWMVSSKNSVTAYKIDYSELDITRRILSDKLLEISFFASNKIDEYQRIYKKLPETLGSLVGLMNIIMAACFIFTQIATYLKTMKIIMNTLYSFPQLKGFPGQKKELSSLRKTITRKAKELKFNNKNFNLNSKIKKELDIALKQRNRRSTTQSIALMKDKALESIKSIDLGEENASSLSQNFINSEKNIKGMKSTDGRVESKNLEEDSFNLNHYSLENEKEIEKEKIFHSYINNLKNTDRESEKRVKKKKTDQKKDKIISSKFHCFKQGLKKLLYKQKKKSFKIGFFEYLFTKLRQAFRLAHGESGRMIIQAEKKYCEELDIINLLNKIHDIEKLKLLLLDSDQLALFNCLTKPLIFSDIDFANLADISETRMSLIINNYRKKKDLTLSYERVLAQDSEINKKLISFVDERIAQTFAKNC